jgi:AcrR family transcriptional regulator
MNAALRVAERAGVGGITIEAVAAEAGLTKGGVIYHFPTRGALLAGIHRELADRWDAQMRELLGGEPAGASQRDRLAAYIRASAATATPGEYLFVSDAETTRNNVDPWDDVSRRWIADPPEPRDDGSYDPEALRLFAAQLAADGLWSHEFVNGQRMTPELRTAAAEAIIRSLDD